MKPGRQKCAVIHNVHVAVQQNVSVLNCQKMFSSKSAARIFTSGPTSCCHCNFFQYVTIEGKLKGKSHSLQIRSKKGKEDRSQLYTGEKSTYFTVVTASLSAEMLSSDNQFNITSLSHGPKVNVNLNLLVWVVGRFLPRFVWSCWTEKYTPSTHHPSSPTSPYWQRLQDRRS